MDPPDPIEAIKFRTEHRDSRAEIYAVKVKALGAAARVGVGALDRGEFKEFSTFEELQAYLNEFSEKVISRTAE